ncbi:MAG TPA: hypothetical protein IAA90_06620 [Candidatus Ornithoclostridium excrementipullorum]|nr:hypothetical protein [Candidatus Ornithoclostridium excrementipullorum]
MNNYERMKLAEKLDEDCDFVEDFGDLDAAEKYESDAEAFKRRYKEFYSDIKLSHKEDW